MGRLDGKVALISGVARGQGRSHAIRLAQEGAAIIGFDAMIEYDTVPFSQATESDLDETVGLVKDAGGQIIAGRADVRRRGEIQALVDEGVDAFGNIAIVVANAGIGINGRPFWEVSEAEWVDCLDVNLKGVWNTVSAAMKSILAADAGGSIIMTSSAAALKAAPNIGAYSAAKLGVIGLMRSMANDLAPYKIRANVVCPASVSTPFLFNDRLYRLFRPDLPNPTLEDAKPVMAQMAPLGEPWVEPEDVSNVVAFLASDEARYMTGVVVPVDLGLSIKF